MRAMATRVSVDRPDLSRVLVDYLGVPPLKSNPLDSLTVGELGVVYEAVIALGDHVSRKRNGQYFTPDDVSQMIVEKSLDFDQGTWIDPCCGVGNLAWHLVRIQDDPSEFARHRLFLNDLDEVALKCAVVLIVASFAGEGDQDFLVHLSSRSSNRDFLDRSVTFDADYVVMNPPYVRVSPRAEFDTARAGDLYAYFMEQAALNHKGFISITPASYTAAAKFSPLRRLLLEKFDNIESIVFDNVPDTVFRGFKYGSVNSSNVNFVRGCVTVCGGRRSGRWITPILRWRSHSRSRMFQEHRAFLSPLEINRDDVWVKLMPETRELWFQASSWSRVLKDLTIVGPSDFFLEIATTPRYYISASTRPLDRSSKVTLYFAGKEERNAALVAVNSSLVYWWWRSLDGGITLKKSTLLSCPIPDRIENVATEELVRMLLRSEASGLVTKLNAGKVNENIKHSPAVVRLLDEQIFGDEWEFSRLYEPDLPATLSGG